MKLQQTKGQFTITIPKDLVIGFNWIKGTQLNFEIVGAKELKICEKK